MSSYLKDRVTIYEVAAAAGVSLATVSRVINNHDNVTKETREKVQAAINRLGYRPSALAQALATSKTTNIGVIIPSANYVYISNMLHGITEAAREKGFAITLFCTSHNKQDAIFMMDKLIKSHVDGAIVFDDELDEADIQKITGYQVPVVVVNNRIDEGAKVGCITFGYEHDLRELILKPHFAKNTKKMYFATNENTGRLLERLQRSFIKTHNDANKDYGILQTPDNYELAYEYFDKLFKETKTGYFVTYRDSLAAAVLNAATSNNLHVPNDIEILSLIGTKYAQIFRPRISNMQLDMYKVGISAVEMLTSLLDGEENIKRIKIESEFIALDTTL